MRNIIKKIWKRVSYYLISFYLLDKDVFIVNKLEDIPKYPSGSYSQFGQDAYIFKELFKTRNSGVFIDVGGNDPIHCNNTYLFELNGWTGLAIEPQDNLRVLWQNKRKTLCLDCVVGPTNKDVIFVEGGESEHGLAGVLGANKVSKINQKEIIKKQMRLDNILLENNLTQVDFVSIDVEGYEMQVLESIDFKKININVICIENNINFTNIPIVGKYFGSELGSNIIRNFLRDKGYRQVARLMCDDIFIKI